MSGFGGRVVWMGCGESGWEKARIGQVRGVRSGVLDYIFGRGWAWTENRVSQVFVVVNVRRTGVAAG